MAVAVDASSPIRWADVVDASPGEVTVSSAFTAPTNALLTVCICIDTDGVGNNPTLAISDSGGLTWTIRVERQGEETTAGGYSAIATARTTSSVSRTVTVGYTGVMSNRQVSNKCYVLTGVDVDGTPVDTVGANNEGGSTTNNLTTSSLTPGATGLLVVSDTDWNAAGSFEASSDLTQDTATYTGISVCSGYKVCTSGVGVTANLNAAGSGAVQHKWCQIIVREAAGGAAFLAKSGLVLDQAVHRANYW